MDMKIWPRKYTRYPGNITETTHSDVTSLRHRTTIIFCVYVRAYLRLTFHRKFSANRSNMKIRNVVQTRAMAEQLYITGNSKVVKWENWH